MMEIEESIILTVPPASHGLIPDKSHVSFLNILPFKAFSGNLVIHDLEER